jgi:hypothetical protein
VSVRPISTSTNDPTLIRLNSWLVFSSQHPQRPRADLSIVDHGGVDVNLTSVRPGQLTCCCLVSHPMLLSGTPGHLLNKSLFPDVVPDG